MGEQEMEISQIVEELFSCEEHLEFFSRKYNNEFITFPENLREEAEENLVKIKKYLTKIKESFGEYSYNQIKTNIEKILTRTNASLFYLNKGNQSNHYLQFSKNYYYTLNDLVKFHKKYEDLTKTEHIV